jgi:hypothetical protein
MVDGPKNKHQEMATTGHFKGFAKGGHAHKEHGHKDMHEHHPKEHHGGHKKMSPKEHRAHGGSIHCVTSESGESTSAWDTDSVGTGGGGKHEGGGGTGGTRNRI